MIDHIRQRLARIRTKPAMTFEEREEKETLALMRMIHWMCVLLLCLMVALIFRACTSTRPFGWERDFGTAVYETDDSVNADPARLNIAVLPDYNVTTDSPYILIPYPKDNANDVSFAFRNADDGTMLYTTKHIRPGTVVRVNPYEFCQEGDNRICVDVRVYEKDTVRLIASDVTLETTIHKDGKG